MNSGFTFVGVGGDEFWSDIDEMPRGFEQDANRQESCERLTAEAAAGISRIARFVSWALRAGSTAASFLAAIPTWRNFDPMPVLASDEKQNRNNAVADDDPHVPDHDVDDVDQLFDC